MSEHIDLRVFFRGRASHDLKNMYVTIPFNITEDELKQTLIENKIVFSSDKKGTNVRIYLVKNQNNSNMKEICNGDSRFLKDIGFDNKSCILVKM